MQGVENVKQYLIGVDIGGTSVKIGAFNREGNLLEKWEIPTDKTDHGSRILADIHRSLLSRVAFSDIIGIGFGVPGPVSDGVVFNCVNLGWGKTDVEAEFRKLMPFPEVVIRVSNDANVAAAGELFQGGGVGVDNLCFFTLGTGVGGGIVIDGKIVDGVNGLGGELGHLVVDREGRFACNCGKRGCLETVASATGIVNLARLHMASDPLSSLHHDSLLTAKAVFDAAKAGDSAALKAVDEAADYLAYSCSLVTFTINPERFIFGGGVAKAGMFLVEKIAAAYPRYVRPFLTRGEFALATLGSDAGIFGAAYLVRP